MYLTKETHNSKTGEQGGRAKNSSEGSAPWIRCFDVSPKWPCCGLDAPTGAGRALPLCQLVC